MPDIGCSPCKRICGIGFKEIDIEDPFVFFPGRGFFVLVREAFDGKMTGLFDTGSDFVKFSRVLCEVDHRVHACHEQINLHADDDCVFVPDSIERFKQGSVRFLNHRWSFAINRGFKTKGDMFS